MKKNKKWKKFSEQKITLIVLIVLLISIPLFVITLVSPVIFFPKAASVVSSTGNLVVNGTFESINSRGKATNWSYGSKLSKTDGLSTEKYSSPTHSFKFVGNRNRKELTQKIRSLINKDSLLDLKIKVEYDKINPDGYVAAIYDFYDINGKLYDSFEMKVDTRQNVEWLDRGDKYVTKYDTSMVVVKLVVENQRGNIYFDDIYLSSKYPSATITPTATPKVGPCEADINNDGFVDVNDYSILANPNNFSQTNPANPRTDINKDGIVNEADADIIKQFFLQSCPTPTVTPTYRPLPTTTPLPTPKVTSTPRPIPVPTTINYPLN